MKMLLPAIVILECISIPIQTVLVRDGITLLNK